MIAAAPVRIEGEVSPGYEPVREAFARNFHDGKEIGAACAVWRDGRLVVDLWGGVRDHRTGAAWERDTLVGFFSVTKGMAAACLALAHSRGWLDYEAPVAAYWPEFAQQGKGRITVRQLLAHQAGLCALDRRVDAPMIADHDRLADLLARQRPRWTPGRRHGYHAVTLGWYEGELLRRIDPARRSLGVFLRDEIARPLGVEFHIGTPHKIGEERIARIKDFRPAELLYRQVGLPLKLVASVMAPWTLSARAMLNPRVARPADLLRPPLRNVEIPSGNGIGTARAVATVYGVLAGGGHELGVRPETVSLLEAPARPPKDSEYDLVLKVHGTRYALGMGKPFGTFRFGTDDRAYGTPGLGGSMGLADPATRIGYAYVPNRSGFYLWDDPRERRVREAVYRCVRG